MDGECGTAGAEGWEAFCTIGHPSPLFGAVVSSEPLDPLAADLRTLPGATPTRLELLGRLGLRTVGDLLFHFPRSYEDLTDLRPIAALAADAPQTVQGEVVEIEGRNLASGGTWSSVVLSDDGKHCLEGVWFNQPYAARPLPLRPARRRSAASRSGIATTGR